MPSREEIAILYEASQGKYGGAEKRRLRQLLKKPEYRNLLTDEEYRGLLYSTRPVTQTREFVLQGGSAPIAGALGQAKANYDAQQAQVNQLEMQPEPAQVQTTPQAEPKYTVPIKPSSQPTNDIVREYTIKQAFPAYSALAESTNRQVNVTTPPRQVATVQTERTILGRVVSRKTEQIITPLGPTTKPQGTLTAFVPERDLQAPKFLGITEPGSQKLRVLEYQLVKKAGQQDIKAIRNSISSGGKSSPLSLSASFYQGIATPVKVVNRPLTSSAAIATFFITKGALSAGGPITAGQASAGILAGGTAINVQQEIKAGGTGSKALGELGFTLAATGVVIGAAKLKSAVLDKTSITYDISSKGKAASQIQGVTRKGSILNNKAYSESFTIKGDTTYRSINYKGKTLKIIEQGTYQATKIFKGGKLIGEDFQYINPAQSIRASVVPQLQGRKTLFLDQTELSRTSKFVFLETRSGSIKQRSSSQQGIAKLDLTVSEAYKRQIIATDQLVKISGKGLRSVEFIKPQFQFSTKTSYPKDQVIIQQTGFGKNAAYQRVDIIAPRVVEKSPFIRQISGTLEITKQPLLSKLSLSSFSLGKKGSASPSTVLDLVPKISIGPKPSTGFSFQLQTSSIQSSPASKLVPIFSFESKPKVNISPGTKSSLNAKIQLSPFTGSRQSSRPAADIGSAIEPSVVPAQKPLPRIKTSSSAVQVSTGLTSPLASGPLNPGGFNFNISKPSTPISGGLAPRLKLP